MCKRNFSRKSNAFRHNKTVHSDLSKIVLNSTNSSPSLIRLINGKNDYKSKFHKFKILKSIYDPQEADGYLDNSLIEEEKRPILIL